jgi:hypothetical protein
MSDLAPRSHPLLNNTVPPLHRTTAQFGNKLVKGSTRGGAINDVIGEWCLNCYSYVLISNTYLGVVGNRMVRCFSYDSSRNPTDATEQRSIRKRTTSYFETSGAIALSPQLTNFHG